MPAALRPAVLLDLPLRLLSRMAAFGRGQRHDDDVENGAVDAVVLSAPVELDVDENGRVGPSAGDRPTEEPANGKAAGEPGLGRRNGSPLTKPDPGAGREPSPRPSLEAELGPRLDRTLTEVRRIAGHLDGDEDRNQRLVGHLVDRLDGLPAAVAPLPEIGRESTRLLGLLGDQFERTAATVETLGASLQDGQTRSERLAKGHHELLGEQTRLLGGLQEAIQETTGAARDSSATLELLESAADRLAATTDRLANALQKASESARSRELRMTAALDRTHRWTVTAVYVCGGIATLAAIGVGLVLVL